MGLDRGRQRGRWESVGVWGRVGGLWAGRGAGKGSKVGGVEHFPFDLFQVDDVPGFALSGGYVHQFQEPIVFQALLYGGGELANDEGGAVVVEGLLNFNQAFSSSFLDLRDVF